MSETATSPNELNEKDIARLRRRLLDMRAELQTRGSGRDVLQLKRVDAALEKIARGRYGSCDSCSRPLLKSRVLETPHVRYCAVCSGGRLAPSPRGRGGSRSSSRPVAPAPAPAGPASL